MARLRISIVFESGARIGPGKAQLLESIRDTGSISAAAREMGMSYKRTCLNRRIWWFLVLRDLPACDARG